MTEKLGAAPIDDEHYRQASEWARDDAVTDGIHRTQEEVEVEADRLRAQAEEKAQKAEALASAFHEQWRETRRTESGFEPRVKETTDARWIEEHGTNQVDIANTEYAGLPSDWQAENKAAADVIVGIMHEKGTVDLGDEDQRLAVGEQIHSAWLQRNDWAQGGELDKPFADLPLEEQAKDIDQMIVAQEILSK